MPGKTFTNATSYDLSVMLTVRQGVTPGTDLPPVNFSLNKGNSQYVPYGDDNNPFLDGIAINGIDKGNLIASQEFAITRGSSIDNDFNTNDHVAVRQSGDSFVLSFNNG
jgi:hypothetical protein